MTATSIGARIGNFFGRILDITIGDRIRAHYAAVYGKCSRCEAPLAGPSPSQMCEPCHADHVLGILQKALAEAAQEEGLA